MYSYKITTVQDVLREYIVEAESPEDALDAWDHNEYELVHVGEGEEDARLKDVQQLKKLTRS